MQSWQPKIDKHLQIAKGQNSELMKLSWVCSSTTISWLLLSCWRPRQCCTMDVEVLQQFHIYKADTDLYRDARSFEGWQGQIKRKDNMTGQHVENCPWRVSRPGCLFLGPGFNSTLWLGYWDSCWTAVSTILHLIGVLAACLIGFSPECYWQNSLIPRFHVMAELAEVLYIYVQGQI